MKKNNILNLLIVIFSFILIYVVDHFVITAQGINLNEYGFQFSEAVGVLVAWIVYVILLLPVLYIITKKMHHLYIKKNKSVKLGVDKSKLFITSLVVSYSFVHFNVHIYMAVLAIALVILFYFISLYVHDRGYVRTSTTSKVIVSDETTQQLLTFLGGEANIDNVTFEASRLKVILHDVKKADLEGIKSLGATGLFVAGNKIQAIVGSSAAQLEQSVNNYLLKQS